MTEWMTVYERYQPQLSAVDTILSDAVGSSHHLLQAAARGLIQAGGKRIRPLFAFICSGFGDPERQPQVESVAAALELVHMATLVHDDVIDDADLRRGRPTVRNRFGNRAAMYTGDFLFARAIHLLSTANNPALHQKMAEAIVRICEGEIEQIRDFYNWKQGIRTYLRRIERKTALLIAVSCELGAQAALAPPAVVERLRRFGYYTGMAFQIVDDLLDFEGSEAVVGKPVAGDLQQGNLTLPAIYCSRSSHGEALRSMVHPGMTDGEVRSAVELIRESGGIDVARQTADWYLRKALDQLPGIPFPERHDELEAVASFVNHRAY